MIHRQNDYIVVKKTHEYTFLIISTIRYRWKNIWYISLMPKTNFTF